MIRRPAEKYDFRICVGNPSELKQSPFSRGKVPAKEYRPSDDHWVFSLNYTRSSDPGTVHFVSAKEGVPGAEVSGLCADTGKEFGRSLKEVMDHAIEKSPDKELWADYGICNGVIMPDSIHHLQLRQTYPDSWDKNEPIFCKGLDQYGQTVLRDKMERFIVFYRMPRMG